MATQENSNRAAALLGLLDDHIRAFLGRHPGVAVTVEVMVLQRGEGDTADVSTGFGDWLEDRPMHPGEAWALGMARQGLELGQYSCGCPPSRPASRAARRRAARGR